MYVSRHEGRRGDRKRSQDRSILESNRQIIFLPLKSVIWVGPNTLMSFCWDFSPLSGILVGPHSQIPWSVRLSSRIIPKVHLRLILTWKVKCVNVEKSTRIAMPSFILNGAFWLSLREVWASLEPLYLFPFLSMKPMSLASSQHWLCIVPDAQCKRDLTILFLNNLLATELTWSLI